MQAPLATYRLLDLYWQPASTSTCLLDWLAFDEGRQLHSQAEYCNVVLFILCLRNDTSAPVTGPPDEVPEVASACTVLLFGRVAILFKLATDEYAESATFAGLYGVKPHLATAVVAGALKACSGRGGKTAFALIEPSAAGFYQAFGFEGIRDDEVKPFAQLLYKDFDNNEEALAGVAKYGRKFDLKNVEEKHRNALDSIKRARQLLSKSPPERDGSVRIQYDHQPRAVVHTCYGSSQSQRVAKLIQSWLKCDNPPGSSSSFKTFFEHACRN